MARFNEMNPFILSEDLIWCYDEKKGIQVYVNFPEGVENYTIPWKLIEKALAARVNQQESGE